MKIRKGLLKDAEELAEITASCFQGEEVISKEVIEARIRIYPHHFWLLEDEGVIISYVNGMVTNQCVIEDDMFYNPSLHQQNGAWQTIFGVNTRPAYRGHGYAVSLLKQVASDTMRSGYKGCILTCKEELIAYYEKLGYQYIGKSKSSLAGVVWYDMRLKF